MQHNLVMLGRMQLQAKEYKEASATLEKAADSGFEKLAGPCLIGPGVGTLRRPGERGCRDGACGRVESRKGSGYENSQRQTAANGRERRLAEEVFQSFIKSYPQDPAVPDVRKYIEKIEETRKAAAAAAAVSTPEAFEPTAADSEAAGNEKLEEAWAPPDVDAGMPPTAAGVISVYHRPKLPYYFAEDRTTDGTS